MTPKQRDIVLIPVPFTDLTATKRRPVLVLSTTEYNRKSEDVLVAAITSNLTFREHGVPITSGDLAEGALPAKSLVKADRIYSLSKSIVVKHYGRLSDAMFENVLQALDDVLGRKPQT